MNNNGVKGFMIIKASDENKNVMAVCIEEKSSKIFSEKEEVSFVKDKFYDVCEVKIKGEDKELAYKCKSEEGMEFYFTKDKFSKYFRTL